MLILALVLQKDIYQLIRILLVFLMILATLPLVFIALVLEYTNTIDLTRNLEIIAFTNILFAILLFASDRKIGRRKLGVGLDRQAALAVEAANNAQSDIDSEEKDENKSKDEKDVIDAEFTDK